MGARAAGRITEKALAQQIVDLARAYGWLVYRTWNSIHSPAGFPDLCMVRGERVVFVELKVGKNTLGPAQIVWRDALNESVAEWYEWRETTDTQWIVRVLAA